MHKDVLKTIYSYQLDELLRDTEAGNEINVDFVINTLSVGMSANHESYVELSQNYNDLFRKYESAMLKIIYLNKQSMRDRRIMDLFLRNLGNGLDWKYDNFESRIYNNLYKRGIAKQ